MDYEKKCEMEENSKPLKTGLLQKIRNYNRKKRKITVDTITQKINIMKKADVPPAGKGKIDNDVGHQLQMPKSTIHAFEVLAPTNSIVERTKTEKSHKIENNRRYSNRNTISTHSSAIFNRTRPLTINSHNSDREKLISLKKQIKNNYWRVGVGCLWGGVRINNITSKLPHRIYYIYQELLKLDQQHYDINAIKMAVIAYAKQGLYQPRTGQSEETKQFYQAIIQFFDTKSDNNSLQCLY